MRSEDIKEKEEENHIIEQLIEDGEVLIELGLLNEAVEYYLELLRLHEKNIEVMKILTEILERINEQENV